MLDDAWRAVAELAASQHGAFTRSQAADRGIDARRLGTGVRQHRVRPMAPNVFAFEGTPRSGRQELMVASLAGCGAVASHRAAAHLHGLDGFSELCVEVSVLANQRWRSPFESAVVHRVAELPRLDCVVVDGIRCTGIARTLADLGSVVGEDAVLRALIGVHARGKSLMWMTQTARRLHRPGQSGTRVLLRQLDRVQRSGTVPASWLEEVLRRIIEHPSLPPLVSQHELRDASGRLVARFDHAFPDARLAIEGHSRKFHFGPIAESADEDRDLRVARRGWEILYLGWYAQRRPADVVTAISEVVSHRVCPPG